MGPATRRQPAAEPGGAAVVDSEALLDQDEDGAPGVTVRGNGLTPTQAWIARRLSGRFSVLRRQVGLLVCRSLKDKKKAQQRCIDTAKDGRGYVVLLDDEDLAELVSHRQAHRGAEGTFPLLMERFKKLIS